MPKRCTCAYALRFSLAAITLCLIGCGGRDIQPAPMSEISRMKTAAAVTPSFQPGEKLHIYVEDEPTLTGDFPIDPSGYLSMPVVGTIKVDGMTPEQLQTRLVAALKAKSIRQPGVTISVMQFKPFYILGEVEKPGAYDYLAGLNVLSAIAIAGGQTFRADKSEIYVQHVGEAAMHSYELNWPIPVFPGDVIEVPRRTI
jgi:protein involved in polysaccharide export with SLBB domain